MSWPAVSWWRTGSASASIDPTDDVDANVPFHKRFFLGGATSIRGWGRFEITPLSEGFPIGGLSMLDGSSEVRFPIWRRLGAVAFVDYGNVWAKAWEFDVRDLRYAVGPGLRYQTPIGPARIDFGYQLNPIDGLLVNGEPQKQPVSRPLQHRAGILGNACPSRDGRSRSSPSSAP